MTDKYKVTLQAFCRDIKTYSLEARDKRDQLKGTDSYKFHNGYLCGFHRSVSLVQQLTLAMGVPLEEIGLEDFDPDEELI